MIPNANDKIELKNQGVYKISCRNCNKSYVVQTEESVYIETNFQCWFEKYMSNINLICRSTKNDKNYFSLTICIMDIVEIVCRNENLIFHHILSVFSLWHKVFYISDWREEIL